MVVIDTRTVWLCPDCVQLLANGEVAEDAENTPMALLDGEEVTLGLIADEHHEDCDFRNSRHAMEAEEMFGVPEGEEPTEQFDCNLGCDHEDFSHNTCDGCGGLPGARDAATVWIRKG